MTTFAERLLLLREERGLSQQMCAKNLQLSPRAYQYYESGERYPALPAFIRIADFYGVSLDYLAGRSDT